MEAIRHALYKHASKKGKPDGSFKKSFGNGILKAFDALMEPVKTVTEKTPADSIPWFPILSTIFKSAPKPGIQAGNKMAMFHTELAQLVYYYPDLAALLGNEKKSYDAVSKKQWQQFKDAVIQHPSTSLTLKKHLMATKF